MPPTTNPTYIATAFVSCSLRTEDKPFIDWIEEILIAHKIQPIGTVGRCTAAPENPAISMRNNINQADMVVGDRLINGVYDKVNKRFMHSFGNSLVRNLVNFLLNTKKEIRAVNKTIKPFNI